MTTVINRVGRIGGLLRSGTRAAGERSRAVMAPPLGVFVVGVMLTLALAAGLFALVRTENRLQAVEQARVDALSAAQSHVTEILSYDYRTIEEDVAQAKADITGTFRKEYAKTASTALVPTAKEQQTVVKAQVRDASVVRAEPEEVVVLLFVNQSRERKGDSEVKVDQNRVLMTLSKVDDKWLVSKVEAL